MHIGFLHAVHIDYDFLYFRFEYTKPVITQSYRTEQALLEVRGLPPGRSADRVMGGGMGGFARLAGSVPGK